jgi:hypothetical protein
LIFFEHHKDKVDCFLDAAEVLVRQSIEQYQKDGREHLDRMSAEDRDLLTEMRLELFRFLNGNGEVFKDR